jgi:hypothetical protein
MTKTIIAAAVLLLTASAQAADSRQQFISGNPDSDSSHGFHDGMPAAPGTVASDLDLYHGIPRGNPDLFATGLGPSPVHMRPAIYGPFGASPDLSY